MTRPIGAWLPLAAAPTFALLGLMTALTSDAHGGPLCAAGGEASLLAGMTPMYLLMALFHLPPWLSLRTPARG